MRTTYGGQVDTGCRRITRAAHEITGWEQEGIRYAARSDPEYPGQLLTVPQPPPFLTWRGVLEDLDAQGVAVVGTRNPSPRGSPYPGN